MGPNAPGRPITDATALTGWRRNLLHLIQICATHRVFWGSAQMIHTYGADVYRRALPIDRTASERNLWAGWKVNNLETRARDAIPLAMWINFITNILSCAWQSCAVEKNKIGSRVARRRATFCCCSQKYAEDVHSKRQREGVQTQKNVVAKLPPARRESIHTIVWGNRGQVNQDQNTVYRISNTVCSATIWFSMNTYLFAAYKFPCWTSHSTYI